ncbi:MAG: transposase [Candidatus Cloacimonetes bacterium]|nr:transposase [Candidatus Cloacimonadota bacterium]
MNNISEENFKPYYKSRHLPHMFDIDKPIFFTFRLKFTLPKHVLEDYNKQINEWHTQFQTMNEPEKANALKTKDHQLFVWFDELIAKSSETPQILHRDDICKIIAEALLFHDKVRYQLLAYCIMPNHVHVLIYPKKQETGEIYPPARITYTWKTYTAKAINKLLSRQGSLWQKESYDRMVRDEKELYNTVDYIAQNPVNAGLVEDWKDWRGTYIAP